jgi:hypothetical protein
LDGVDKAENRVAKVLVDTAASRLATCKHNIILLKFLYVALLPGVLVLANDNGGVVSPQEEKGVCNLHMVEDVLFGG